jgi:hypothetical protein
VRIFQHAGEEANRMLKGLGSEEKIQTSSSLMSINTEFKDFVEPVLCNFS